MANPEHMERLRAGAAEWNAWRSENLGIVPDLRLANLDGADLAGFELSRVDLSKACLSNSRLEKARLSNARLVEASLIEAKLEQVDLRFSNLTLGNLTNADLSGADLTRTLLQDTCLAGTNVRQANFHRARLVGTVFANVDLSDAVNLDEVRHAGRSFLDTMTLTRSRTLPLRFLRGCGLPDQLIDYLPSLLDRPIQYYSAFISHSSDDAEFARRLHADLQDSGVRCWFAPEDMKIGDQIRSRIDEVIRIHDKLLLILSASSVSSEWVEREVEAAFEKERERRQTTLFPIRVDDAVMDSRTGWAADIRRTRHLGDFTGWKNHDSYQRSFDRLLRDLAISTPATAQ